SLLQIFYLFIYTISYIMKTIGLIGGISWQSTTVYYQILNRTVKERVGRYASCKCLINSVNMAEIRQHQYAGAWDTLGDMMAEAATQLAAGGADMILICANTMHKVAAAIEARVSLPLIHIADETAQVIQAQRLKKVGLLGTHFTMQEDFYKGRLLEKHGIEVVVPNEKGIETVNTIIYEELIHGEIRDTSRQAYQEVIHELVEAGAEGVILGCTEIPLLIQQKDSPVPVFDTTYIHATAAVEAALG
ncbi:MAG: aspartate/glutamate racemase family protein, partial [Bacteroidota bacterium]